MVVPRGFYLSTDDIFKHDSFTEPIWLDNAGIDQDVSRPCRQPTYRMGIELKSLPMACLQLFFDDATGKVWMSTADFITDRKILDKKAGVPIVVVTREIELATGRSLTHDVVNCYSSVGNGVAEGPHLFRRGGRYYLSVAIGGTDICHQQWIYRSDSPLGPWEAAPSPINPMVFNDDHPEVRLTGHMDLCPGDGGIDGDHWWACFLGVRPQWDVEHKVHDSQLGRETFLCPVEWQDGWPIVNRGQKVEINGLGETGLVRLPDEFAEEYSYNPSERECV
jgi:beta-xylosidase